MWGKVPRQPVSNLAKGLGDYLLVINSVISRIWADRCMVVELQFGGCLFAFLYQAITSLLTLSSVGLSAHHFSPFLSSCLSHNFLKCSSSSSACSLLAMETLGMAVLASPAQGSYNYLLTIYLLTTSYNYTEFLVFFFFFKRKMFFPALWVYSLLLGRAKLTWFLCFYPVIFLSCNLFLVGVRVWNMAQQNFIRWPDTNGSA